jgi:hypothetical protein
MLRSHGYADPERSLEILHVTIEDVGDDVDADEPRRQR